MKLFENLNNMSKIFIRIRMQQHYKEGQRYLRYASIAKSKGFREQTLTFYRKPKIFFETISIFANPNINKNVILDLTNFINTSDSKIQKLSRNNQNQIVMNSN
jgi:hypothetical protein